MSFSFHSEAEDEFNNAIDYYEDIEPGLGYDFALEVYSAIQRSIEFPKAWAILEGDIRRSLVKDDSPTGFCTQKSQMEYTSWQSWIFTANQVIGKAENKKPNK